ncbi:hypothetical protein N7495_001355 [Penicillium taxi]|uniref:uncharacterized protein n=1 Tax=Penicillium taxi TaxID=168475 RepID=UPI0025454469|nr:uncharacterized protein N7495_001355 [Penicillium taxi]KAJ5908673.1 hypothetical protein N7495_001355 [Penicillium taxi]
MAEMSSAIETSAPLPTPAFTNNHSEHTLSDEKLKHRSPYKLHLPGEFGEIKWSAHCQCRKISYSLKQYSPIDAKFCHCRTCQVMHGAPYQWAAIFNKDDISFDHGCSGLLFYSASHNTQESELPMKVSCSFCHTLIMDEYDEVCLLFPQLIEFDGTSDDRRKQMNHFKPSCHVFYEQRMLDISDGLPKWSEMANSSRLLNDGGHKI